MVTRKPINKKKNEEVKGKVDSFLLIFTIILIAFGAVMIFDSSVYQANRLFHDQYYFLRQHIIWLFLGSTVGLIAYLIPYKMIVKLSPLIYLVTFILLIAVLITGDAVNGSKRWFTIGSLPIQPAEFAKPVVVILLAGVFAKLDEYKRKERVNDKEFLIRKGVIILTIIGLTLLPIVLEPDLGTTMLIGATMVIMFFLSDTSKVHVYGSMIIAAGFAVLGTIAGLFASYRLDRVKTFLHLLFKGVVDDPNGTGYQIQQILIGIGSGGFWGKGFGQSRQRFGYLVENTAFTDSIFAVVLEELGYIGGIIFVGLWIAFLWRILKLSQRATDKTVSLLIAGIGIWLSLQAFLNMAANVGLIPLTGIPLPFFTYGGSNTIVTLAGIGLLLNVSRYATNEK